MDKQLQQLQIMLTAQIQSHQKMTSLMNDKLAALRRADHQALARALGAENQQLQLIGELEKQRLQLVAELTRLLDPAAKVPLRLAELAQRLPQPWRRMLEDLRAQLVQVMAAVQEQTAVSRRASENLLRHMQGLMQTIGAAVTGVAVYGRKGESPRAALAVSTFETRA